jgi:hypothetical protein
LAWQIGGQRNPSVDASNGRLDGDHYHFEPAFASGHIDRNSELPACGRSARHHALGKRSQLAIKLMLSSLADLGIITRSGHG